MNISDRINVLADLGNFINQNTPELQEVTHKAFIHNTWFTPKNIELSLINIAENFLEKEKLENWIANYDFSESNSAKTIAIVAAGNIPLVSFHDILCVLISGNKLQLKLSEKDNVLLPFILQKLIAINPAFKEAIQIVTRLENFDAIIATGSNNTANYFEYYFGKYKNIIRKNRNSIAILDGTENLSDLKNLGNDVFDYFGLGCRNVSKIFVPASYDLMQLKAGFESFHNVMQHTQYMNNLDYQRTIYLMNQIPMLDIDFINIVENKSLYSPLACLHYEFYNSNDDVINYIIDEKNNLQCIVGKEYLPFGKSQQPSLTDYADNIDVLNFVTNL